MAEESDQASRLDQVNEPIAVVHDGFFVYANAAFFEKLGFRTFAALQETPILDLVEDGHRDRLRQHLHRGTQTAGTEPGHPATKLTFVRPDGLPIGLDTTAFKTRFAGEDCVQLTLLSGHGEDLGQRIRNLPWKLYFSIAFLILFTVMPLAMLVKLNINNAPKVYFPDDEPAVVLDNRVREYFPKDEVFVFLFDGVALFSDGFLTAYHELAEAIKGNPLIDKVFAVTMRDHIAGTKDEFIVERLIDSDDLEASNPSQRLNRVVADRFSRGALVAEDGSALAMVVVPSDVGNSIQRMELQNALLEAVEQAKLSGYLNAVAGQIPLDIAELSSMLRDNMIFIPATVTIGLVLIWWLFRRWLAVLLSGVAIGVVTNTTVAIFVLFDQPFTLISSIIPPLLSALTVAALVHLFNAMYQASRHGYKAKERVERALREVEKPARYTALTTAVGLASLGASPIVPIKMFGVISALGTGLIYFVVFVAIPNLLARWDRRPWPIVAGGMRSMDHVVKAFYRTGVRYPAIVIAVAVALLVLGIPQISKVHVETNLQEFFSPDHKIRVDTRTIDDTLQGTTSLDVMFETENRDGLKDPHKLASIRDFQVWVEGLAEVDRSFSAADFIEEMHWAFNAENPEFRRIPDDEQLVKQYLLIYDGDDIYDFVDREFRQLRVNLSLNVHSANDIEAVMSQIRVYLDGNADDQLNWYIAGFGRLFADMEDLLVKGQVYSLWGAVVLIFALMLFLWRSVGDSVLCMIPNLSPIVLIFVTMGFFGIWLDMGTAMIASVAVGIAVDDTIHVYHGFRHRLNRGSPVVVAIARTYRQAGRAVVTTTIILSAQFLILVASEFVPTSNFGLLTTIGSVAALVFDLLLLPALLIVLFDAERPWARFFGIGKKTVAGAYAAGDSGSLDVHWSSDRKAALVKEIFRGKPVDEAAREYSLSVEEVQQWLASADLGMKHALEGYSPEMFRNYERQLKKLVKVYKRTRAENEALKKEQIGGGSDVSSNTESADQAVP